MKGATTERQRSGAAPDNTVVMELSGYMKQMCVKAVVERSPRALASCSQVEWRQCWKFGGRWNVSWCAVGHDNSLTLVGIGLRIRDCTDCAPRDPAVGTKNFPDGDRAPCVIPSLVGPGEILLEMVVWHHAFVCFSHDHETFDAPAEARVSSFVRRRRRTHSNTRC